MPLAIVLTVLAGAGLCHATLGQVPESPPDVLYSRQLDISFKLVPYGKAFGARLTEEPWRGPAEEIRLEKGDMIISLDNEPIRKAEDLETHYSLTPIVFVNIRTGRPQRDKLNLPPNEVKARIAQPDICRAAEGELRKKSIKYQPAEFTVEGNVLRYCLGCADLTPDTSPAVDQQYRVEILRLGLARPEDRQFWEPYLQRVEAVIAEELAYINDNDAPDDLKVQDFGSRINTIYDEALKAKAAATGKTLEPLSPPLFDTYAHPPERIVQRQKPVRRGGPQTFEGGFYKATLVTLTTTPGGTVLLMQRTKYLIRLLDQQKRPITDSEFHSFSPNQPINLSGDYVYKVVYPNGAASTLKTLRIDREGRYTLQ
jgi:hypothetical protein